MNTASSRPSELSEPRKVDRPAVDAVIALEFPGLPPESRLRVVEFASHRFATLPHHMRLGVAIIDRAMGLATTIGGQRFIGKLSHSSLPVIAEYFRLIRSLAVAFIWETWPESAPDGSVR